MTVVVEQVPVIVVWFEGNPAGHAALAEAYAMARRRQAHLTVMTVATHERIIGCGRCLQGTVLWNREMDKIAHEELVEARRVLDGAADVSYEAAVGDPADAITTVATHAEATMVVLPFQRTGRLIPPNRRRLAEKVGRGGPWQVIVAARDAAPVESTLPA